MRGHTASVVMETAPSLPARVPSELPVVICGIAIKRFWCCNLRQHS